MLRYLPLHVVWLYGCASRSRAIMLQTAKCKNNVEVIRKNRKTTAIPTQPNSLSPSISRRRKRSAISESKEGARKEAGEGTSRDGEEAEGGEGAGEEIEEGAHNQGHARTLMSFEKVLRPGGLHTAKCCRLSLPRLFCQRHRVKINLTMTDSMRNRLWHMRFQSCGFRKPSRESCFYVIANGWKEFAYDHSLKANDRLLFTLLSTSRFLVEFATSNGLTRAMLQRRDGEDYPWHINSYRLECLAFANDDVRHSEVLQQVFQEDVIQKNVAPVTSQKDEQTEELPEGLIQKKVNEKNVAPVSAREDEQSEKLLPLAASRQSEAPTTLPNKQQAQEKIIYCQCDTVKAQNEMDTGIGARKEYVPPGLTHLECKESGWVVILPNFG